MPVIPVINHSNSIDKVLEQGHRIDLEARLNKQFVREVSRYLSDLRLIRNIFNEYVVYSSNLAAGEDGLLDPNKLLAVLIYKNVLPQDFAALHRQEGVVSQILAGYQRYISKVEREIRDEIAAIEADLSIGEAQALRDMSELRKVYAMAIVERVPANYYVISIPNTNIQLSQLAEGDNLEKLLAHRTVTATAPHFGNRTAMDISDVQDSIDPNRSLEQRKADLELKSTKFKQRSEKRVRELTARMSNLRTRRFNEIARESDDLIQQLFAGAGENQDLLKFLILEGYLDDTYYQYISLFHSGRLSPNDNNFLIKIRAFNNPPPDFLLDNVAEVVASMRPTDFGQAYVLNRFIVDHLLSDAAAHAARITDAVHYLSTNFSGSEGFFRSYYATGTRVPQFMETLASKWSGFTLVALDKMDGPAHAARIMAYTSDRVLMAPANAGPLMKFLSDHTHRVLAEPVEIDITRLRKLGVEISDVGTLAELPAAHSYVAQEGLYRLTVENIRHILSRVVGWPSVDTLETQHFSTLLAANDAALLKRIKADFPTYVRDVLIKLSANTEEDVSAIAQVLVQDNVDHGLRSEFLKMQTAVFPNLEDVPIAFQQIAMEGNHVEPTWENCLRFMSSPSFHADFLTEYLQSNKATEALGQQPIPGDEPSLPIRQFIVGNDALDLDIYRSYVRMLPRHLEKFQDVDASKTKVLIEEHRVTFTPENFQHLEDTELRVLFVALNFGAYAAQKAAYPLDDDFRAGLLRTSITDPQKLEVLADMDESSVADDPAIAAIVGPLLDRSPNARFDQGVDFIKAVIRHTRELKVRLSLLTKTYRTLSVPDIREVLKGLPEPFQDIATFGKSPKLENSEANRHLAQWLQEKGVISSFSETLLGGEIKINTFRKDSG